MNYRVIESRHRCWGSKSSQILSSSVGSNGVLLSGIQAHVGTVPRSVRSTMVMGERADEVSTPPSELLSLTYLSAHVPFSIASYCY